MTTPSADCEKTILIPWHKPDIEENLFFLLSGMIMSVPFTLLTESSTAYALGASLPTFYAQFISIAIIAPVLEEFAKAHPLYYRHGETEKSIISLGFYTGLGFGLIEFMFYVFFIGAPVLARFFAMIFHATNTSIMAYGIAKKKPWRFYFLAVALHFLINAIAVLGTSQTYLIGLIFSSSYALAAILHIKASDEFVDYCS